MNFPINNFTPDKDLRFFYDAEKRNILSRKKALLFFGGFLFVLMSAWFLFVPAQMFPVKTIVTVSDGMSLTEVSKMFKDKHIVRSAFALNSMVIIFGGEKKIVSGDYYFKNAQSLYTVAGRLSHGDYGIDPVKVTIPEGSNNIEIADILSEGMYGVKKAEFIQYAKNEEGYLFPDTYFFYPNVGASSVIETMQKTFDEKTAPLEEKIKNSGRSLKDIVIMASILEEEANTPESRRMVAGILWERIKINMALQVDAAFVYVNGKKKSSDLTLDDLKIDSLYNTYKYTGLPPGPITNPGIDAILATLEPTKSSYLYYLTGNDGNMYYAKTFEEHKRNKELYLN